MNTSITQPKPITGYAPVNGLKMYYEVHGSGDPVVLGRPQHSSGLKIHKGAGKIPLG
jgi:hypothetical protein